MQHICGSKGEINSQVSGPIAATYLSGDSVLMTAYVFETFSF